MALIKLSHTSEVRDPSLRFVPVYRTDFRNWEINPDCDIEVSDDGSTITIKKFDPTVWIMKSKESNTSAAALIDVYGHWRFEVSGLSNIYDDTLSEKIPYLPFSAVGGTSSTYRVHGLLMCPMTGDQGLIFRFPWDWISSGNFKDQNGGAASCGYIYDGIRDRLNKDSFSDGWGASSFQLGLYLAKQIYPDESKYIYQKYLPTDYTTIDTEKIYIRHACSANSWGCPMYKCTSATADGITWENLGNYKEIVDISENPIIITQLPINLNEYSADKERIFLAKLGSNGIVNLPKRTVENSLSRYFGEQVQGGNVFNGVVIKDIFGENFDKNTPSIKLPIASQLIDLYSYTPENLRIEVDNSNSESYVNWINSYTSIPSNYAKIKNGSLLSAWTIHNTDNPINIVIESQSMYEYLDNLFYGAELHNGSGYTKTNIDDVAIIIRSGRISTAKRAFTKFSGNLNIIHQGVNGETEPSASFGFAPTQLDSTFSDDSQKIIKREWLYWNNLFNISYMCDGNKNVVEVQAHDGAEVILRKFGGAYSRGDVFNTDTWPYGSEQTTWYDLWPQIFRNCENLVTIEPIINVKYSHRMENLYKAFTGCYKLKHLRLKGLNCHDWDFTNSTYFDIPNLDHDSVNYLLENVEDIVNIPFDVSYTFADNVGSHSGNSVDTEVYDYYNIRTQKSLDGLTISCPKEWQVEISPASLSIANAKGWRVLVNNTEISTSEAYGDFENLDSDFNEGVYVKTNYNIGDTVTYTTTSNANWSYKILDCVEGDEFFIITYSGNTPRGYCFVDENDVVLDVCEAGTNICTLVTAPVGAVKLIVNYGTEGSTKKRAIRKK